MVKGYKGLHWSCQGSARLSFNKIGDTSLVGFTLPTAKLTALIKASVLPMFMFNESMF